jgi:UrcA family protein
MKILAASVAALLVMAAAPFAVAATITDAETVSISVSKAHLNLDNPRDTQRLMKRIDTAALEACGAYAQSALGVKRAVAASSCHRDAVAGAMAQLPSSQAALTVTGVRR